MSDRIVYLVSKLTKKQEGSPLEFVTDAGLSAVMAQGYEQVSAMERRVEGVKAVMIVLRPSNENRGVAVHREEAPAQMMSVTDEYGNSRQMLPMQALAEMQRGLLNAIQGMGAAGHLGGRGNHSMPGMTVVSGETVGKAYDMGTIAARAGHPETANPFPGGSPPHTKWLQGYRSAGGDAQVTQRSVDAAFNDGYTLAQSLGRHDRVHCPFPAGSPLRASWLQGFKEGGGVVV